jgi:hypothetical protein
MKPTAKEELMKILDQAPKRVVQIENKLYVFIGMNAKADAAIKKAIASGKTVVEDGVTRWLEVCPVMDTTKEGSDAYTWKDGNTLKVELILFTKQANGEVTKVSRGFVWRNWRIAFGED